MGSKADSGREKVETKIFSLEHVDVTEIDLTNASLEQRAAAVRESSNNDNKLFGFMINGVGLKFGYLGDIGDDFYQVFPEDSPGASYFIFEYVNTQAIYDFVEK